ncbi:MAG: hypothetical protein A2Z16_15560 [Chloroflexi bacterium RBG_16_54_18]|nr:MAG: hypothetical protein A2Z16_15560 [Chloroflexi bacterium RBG_16_54_18]
MPQRRAPSSILPLVLVALGVLLILGAGGWYYYLNLSPPEIVQPSSSVEEENYPDVARVSLADAKAAYDTGSAVFVDVRSAESYAQSHIPGALSIPLAELPDRISELKPSDWIITY